MSLFCYFSIRCYGINRIKFPLKELTVKKYSKKNKLKQLNWRPIDATFIKFYKTKCKKENGNEISMGEKASNLFN